MSTPTLPEPMQQLADHLVAVEALLKHPDVAAQVGDGLSREISYSVVAFRTRFSALFTPGAQRVLL